MKRTAVLVGLIGGLLMSAAPASAHRVPGDCLANGIDLTLAESATMVRQGEWITFYVGIQNTNAAFGKPCLLTNANLGIRLPRPAGRFDPAGAPIRFGTPNMEFPFGFPFTEVGRFNWVVNLDPSAQTGAVQASVGGVLHATVDQDIAEIVKEISFRVTNPVITIDKTGSTTGGQGPQNVVYTYEVTNTSTTPVGMDKVKVDDDLCANPKYSHGDNGDLFLNNGEKWYFTCTALHQNAGVYTNTAKACAMSLVDNRPVCSPPDTWTVTVTNPPVPQGAVKPQQVAVEKCELATPSGLKVRAREQTTIKVTVRNVDAGTVAKIRLPGGKTLSAKTNSKGVATFKVKPPRTGTARITAAACADVERLTVRPARRVVARRIPRVTG
jgi:hypothetical protein